jgi:acetyltransferase-like isoleucine patch superfamily enzyme
MGLLTVSPVRSRERRRTLPKRRRARAKPSTFVQLKGAGHLPTIEFVGVAQRIAAGAFLHLYRGYARLWGKTLAVLAAPAFAEFGKRSVLQPPVRLAGEGRVALGSGVFVGPRLQVLDAAGDSITIRIGDRTSIAGQCVISAAACVELGSDVLFARNVYIADHSHRFDDDLPVLRQGIADVAAVVVCGGAWLGQNVVVCPGVRVGRGAVVGANSVVRDDVPDRAVAVGAPARVVHHLASDFALT